MTDVHAVRWTSTHLEASAGIFSDAAVLHCRTANLDNAQSDSRLKPTCPDLRCEPNGLQRNHLLSLPFEISCTHVVTN